MKRLSWLCPLLLVITACGGGAKEGNDSSGARMQDSIRNAVAAEDMAAQAAQAEQVRLDSIRQDSIAKVKKFIAAIPTFTEIENTYDRAKLFRSRGFTVKSAYHETDAGGWYEVEAYLNMDADHSCSYRTMPEQSKMTIIGAPEALEKYASAAKAYVKKFRAQNPGDPYAMSLKVTVSGNTVTFIEPAD